MSVKKICWNCNKRSELSHRCTNCDVTFHSLGDTEKFSSSEQPAMPYFLSSSEQEKARAALSTHEGQEPAKEPAKEPQQSDSAISSESPNKSDPTTSTSGTINSTEPSDGAHPGVVDSNSGISNESTESSPSSLITSPDPSVPSFFRQNEPPFENMPSDILDLKNDSDLSLDSLLLNSKNRRTSCWYCNEKQGTPPSFSCTNCDAPQGGAYELERVGHTGRMLLESFGVLGADRLPLILIFYLLNQLLRIDLRGGNPYTIINRQKSRRVKFLRMYYFTSVIIGSLILWILFVFTIFVLLEQIFNNSTPYVSSLFSSFLFFFTLLFSLIPIIYGSYLLNTNPLYSFPNLRWLRRFNTRDVLRNAITFGISGFVLFGLYYVSNRKFAFNCLITSFLVLLFTLTPAGALLFVTGVI